MKRNYVLSFITIFLLSFISVAYAAFNSELVITGEGTVQKDTTAPTCGAWYFRDSSLSTQQAYDQNKFINPGTNTTWTSTDKTLFIECTDNMPGEYGCINVDVITDSNNNPRYFKDVKEYTTSIQTDSNVVTVTLKDAYLNERTCTLPVGGSNPYIDKQDPEITITRSAANKFTYSATDNMGVQGYMVTTTATQPALDSENWISTPAEVTIDNTAAKTYYVWAKDGTNIVSSTIKTFKLTKTQGTGTTLTLRYGDSNGATLGTQFVLDGTEVYALAAPNTGYNTVLLKKGSTTLETGTGTASVNSTQTITAATTISSSATVNTYTINFNANGGTGSMASQLMTYGNTTALTTNTFTRVGYTFAGWNTKADGTGTNYTDGQNVSNLVTTNNGSVTLYAKWTANSYTVTANSNSGSIPSTTGWTGTGNTSTKSVTYDSAYGTLPTPTRNGYTFVGWSLLPEGYTQVEYIESTGNQHINTGVTPDATTEIIIDFYTSTNGKWILGSRLSGGTANSFGIYLQGTTQYWAQIGGSEATTGGYVTVSSISGRHVIDVSGYSFKLDDEVKITYNNSISPTNAKDLYIFTINTNGSADSRKMIGKVYSTKIYKNGNVVRDLVPCINDSTGKAGMYDIVNGVFYGNAGTGDFTAGNASYITSETIVKESRNHNIYAKWTANSYTVTANSNGGSIPSTTGWTGTGNTSTKSVIYDSAYGTLPTPTRNGYEFAGWSLLPEGYTQVEYIESTGTQYIATNAAIFNKATHEIIIDFEPTQFYNYNQLYGSTTDNDTFESWIYSNGNLHSRYNGGVYGNQNTLTVNTRYLINFIKSESNLYKYVDGSLIPGGATTVNTSTSTGTLTLFKSGSDYSKYKLYGAKIYANGELVRDYIPCINDSTGKAGLYDIANGVFYGNAGTGDFTAGNASYITSETIVKESRNHSIYAKYTANSYTVTANSNGGSIPSTTGWTGTGNTSTKNVTYGATYGTLPTPTRTGYTFAGWNGKNLLNIDDLQTYSNWSPTLVTYGGYPTSTSNPGYLLDLESGETYTLSYTTPSSSEFPLYFYLCRKNDSTTTLLAYLTTNSIANTTFTFTAEDGYEYYLRAAFSTESVFNERLSKISTIQLEKNSSATEYEPYYITSSTQVTISGNHDIYAKWTKKNYVLTINPAGGTFNGSTSSQLVTQEFESTYNIASTPTKTGYTFTGWLLSGTGSFKYYDDTVTPTETVVKNYDAANSTMPNVYNNKGNGTVTRQMVVDSTATGGYSLSVVTNGEAAPNAGGVNLDIWPTTPDRVNVLEIRAKIPTGYNITLGGIGTSYTGYGANWRANDRAGNDEWKTYQLVVYTGTQGSFTQRAYIYLIGTDDTSVSWNIDSITMKSYTKAQYNSIYTFGAGNATLTAQWGASGSKVTWDKQGGTFGNGTIGTKWTAVASYFTYTSAYTATKLAPYYISENEFAFYKTGYTFDGWYTASTGGTQVFDASGQLNASVTGYSDANKKWQKYENLTLYARWIPNELTFDNQTITKTFSTSSQTANVTVATNGTGTYTYSKVSGESDITVSSAGVITIPASKTANTTGYTVVIRATDSNSGATKDATYTIKINKKKATITRTDESKALTYPVAGTNAYTYDGDGTLSCTSSNTAYVTCSVDTTNGNIIVTPVKPTSSAITITLSATAGTNYSAPDNKTFTVTVAKGTLTATATALNGTYSGSAQYAKIKVTKSDWDGATIVSGTTTSYGQSVTTSGVYNTNYNLKPGYTNVQAQTTIYYKITGGTYYNDLEGSTTATIGKKKATITLTDASKSLTYPTGGSNTYTYDGAATPTCSSSNSTYVTCSVDATNHKINVTAVKPTSSAVTITVSATEASNSNYSSPDNKTFTVTVAKGTCPAPTNVAIATDKKVTWTNATGASSYQISMNSSSGFAAHTNGNAYNSITDATGTRTVYVRSVCDTDYYSSANSSNASASTTVYSVTLTKGTGVSDVKLDGTSVSAAKNYITGAIAELDATVSTGYTWTNWTGSSTIATKSTSITVNGNKSYTANATANKYTITYNYNNAAIITFASGEYAETGYYIDWDSDFTINGVWRYGTAAKRYLVIGNYDDGNKTLNIELNTDNKFRIYMGNGAVDAISSTTVNRGTNMTYAFNWNASTKTYTFTATGTNTNISMTGTYNVSGQSTKPLRYGTKDYRDGSAFVTTTYHTGLSITKEYTYGGTLSNPTDVTKPQYTFNGWFTAASGGTEVTDSTPVPSANTTYYAHWTPNSYTVKFNANGGTGTMANMSFVYDESKVLTTNTFTRDGYTFIGWTTSATGNSGPYYDGRTVSNLTKTNNGTVTMYAQWRKNTYSVVYGANGGTGTMNNQTLTYGTAGTLTANSFTKSGSAFSKWNTKANATGTDYNNQASVTINPNMFIGTSSPTLPSNTTSYAYGGRWGKTSTSITPTLIDVTDAPSDLITKGFNIPNNTTSASYYMYFSNLLVEEEQTYTISVYAKGSGTLLIKAGNSSPTKEESFTLTNTWTRYSMQILASSASTTGGNRVRAANRILNNISFGTPSGNGAIQICGFKMEVGSTATEYVDSNNELDLFAKWTANTYTIAYNMNNGTDPSPKPTSGTYDSDVAIGTTTTPTKTITITPNANSSGATVGSVKVNTMTFTGWTSSSSAGLGANAQTSSTTSNYSSWAGAITTNTHFKNLRSSSGTVTLTANWSTSVTLPTLTSPTGYTCSWYSASGTTGGSYIGTSGGTYTVSSDSASTMTVYARCSPKIYTVTLNKDGGSSGTSEIYEKYSDGYYLNKSGDTVSNKMTTSANPITKPTKTNYKFAGYYTATNGGGTKYIDENGKITSSASATQFTGTTNTLYAKWVDGVAPVVTDLEITPLDGEFTVDMTVTDNSSGVKKVKFYYKKCGASSWTALTEQTFAATASKTYTGWYIPSNGTTSNTCLTSGWGSYYFKVEVTDDAENTATYYSTGTSGSTTTEANMESFQLEAPTIERITYSSNKTSCTNIKCVIDQLEYVFDFEAYPTVVSTFDYAGYDLNVKMKELAGDVNPTSDTVNTTITSFQKSSTAPSASNMTSDHIISYEEDSNPVYMWFSNGTIYWWSASDRVMFNYSTAHFLFYKMDSLTSVDLSGIDMSRVIWTDSMFGYCPNLTSINFGNLWKAELESMQWMFVGCTSLTTLDLSNFDTSDVYNMHGVFEGCEGLTSLNIYGWDTRSVENMESMFSNCQSLTTLDLSNFDTPSLTSTYGMFQGCTNLTTIYAGSGFDVTGVTNSTDMFNNDTSLVGGSGTTYNSSITDKTRAKIDGGSSNPGYFTAK